MADFSLDHLKHFRFKQLFNELGWELPAQQQPYVVAVGEESFALDVMALKKGVQILHCLPDSAGHIPAYALRQKIERKVTAEAREHLIVFTDAAQTTQVWQWVSRTPGRPNQYREVPWRKSESAELLRQKLGAIAFTLDDEESLTVFGVTQRLTVGFDRDKVTKKFYNEFEKQRKAFADFIAGIPAIGEDQRWYTAVLIDRLMFLWFLQEKLFLDGNKRYLQEQLVAHLAAKHKTSFYRRFLCPLFFRGFAEERTEASRAAIKEAYGDVPYLNGGLFAQHELEQRHGAALDVADGAFEKLFAFFGQWDWHLDDRPLASGREINPDVLGYIFEKFVNQKQMGAYYTKEDITEYIGKNTIIPCLLAKVRAEHPGAFDELAWPLLQQSGDAYLYPAMLKGVDTPYPVEIAAGLDTSLGTEAPDLLERRKPWNKRADAAVSLPTEIWREAIARHQRSREVRAKIAVGELREVGDLITHNLDIRQFAQDLIERCSDVALLKSFWFALAGRLPRKSNEKFRHGLSVLDPTCGSGAFLFAALNILKPLYDASLRTLHAVRSDALIAGEKSRPEKWAEVDEILARFAAAKSDRAQDYAVIKHIIVHNLYGVDIEEQATEIAKLRLFLKLVALLEPGDDIEPLPDIDFNIRHGNTLVGYATADETERAVKGDNQGKTFNLFSDAWEDIRIRLVAVEQQYDNFQIQQVQRGGHVSAQDKQALIDTLHDLEETLNYHLAREYGVDPTKTKKYESWKASHKPFHWYVDFFPLIAAGGFDVVIGNPPYVELSAISKQYRPLNFFTESCGNLYALCTERSFAFLNPQAMFGFIVQQPITSTIRMAPCREFMLRNSASVWSSTYDDRPSKLFDGMNHARLAILLASRRAIGPSDATLMVTPYIKWFKEERSHVFERLGYINAKPSQPGNIFPKVSTSTELGVIGKLSSVSGRFETCLSKNQSPYQLFYKITGVGSWFTVTPRPPKFLRAGEQSSSSRQSELNFSTEGDRDRAFSLLNSTLFYWFYQVRTNCRDFNPTDFKSFPVPATLAQEDMRATAQRLWIQIEGSAGTVAASHSLTGAINYEQFRPRRAKSTIDEVDCVLARHYGFSPVELDFLINYDIKYRVGQGSEDADD